MPAHQWLLLLPQTPAVPSSLRVTVWRKMQQLGALSLQNGVWMLPWSKELERSLNTVLAELEEQRGGGFLLVAQVPNIKLEERIVERFRAERQQDYEEFLDRCKGFLEELEKEVQAEKFTFAELEENEEDLHKLMLWLRKIHKRDFFGGAQREAATAALAQCQGNLEQYAEQVYSLYGYVLPEAPLLDEEAPQED